MKMAALTLAHSPLPDEAHHEGGAVVALEGRHKRPHQELVRLGLEGEGGAHGVRTLPQPYHKQQLPEARFGCRKHLAPN